MNAVILISILVVVLLFIAFYLYFNRDPVRTIPPGKSVVSPADGKVIEIIDLIEHKGKKEIQINKGILGKIKTSASEICKHGYVVVIFMDPFNVHVQRMPVEGKILSVKHKKGRFLTANTLNATVENEKIETIIKSPTIGKVKVIQIAGFLTRRIVSFVKKDDILLKGQKLGRIKLGSQVVLIMPDLHLIVKKGDKVIAGETVIAKY